MLKFGDLSGFFWEGREENLERSLSFLKYGYTPAGMVSVSETSLSSANFTETTLEIPFSCMVIP